MTSFHYTDCHKGKKQKCQMNGLGTERFGEGRQGVQEGNESGGKHFIVF